MTCLQCISRRLPISHESSTFYLCDDTEMVGTTMIEEPEEVLNDAKRSRYVEFGIQDAIPFILVIGFLLAVRNCLD